MAVEQISRDDERLGQPQFSDSQNPFLCPLDLFDLESKSIGTSISTDADPDVFIAGDIRGEVEEGQRSFDKSAFDKSAFDKSDSLGEGDNGGQWWLLHTKPRQEKKLAGELRVLKTPHYLPVIKCNAVTRGKTRVSHAPLFPGYFFLFATADQRTRALQTNRIVATHRVGEQEALCKQLFELANLIEKEFPLAVEARFAPGTWVRVKAGVLKGKEGTIIHRGGKTRLFVFINELLGGVSVELEQHLLEPYGDPPEHLRR